MKERLIVSAVLVPIFMFILIFLPPYVLAVLVSIVCAISAYEFQRAVGAKEHERLTIYILFAAVLIPIGVYFGVAELTLKSVLLVLMFLVFAEAIPVYKMKRQIKFTQIMTSIFAGAVIPYMLSSLVVLKNMNQGHIYVLLPVIAAFLTDAGAYFIGVFFGKRRAFPLISPKKTVEGYIGGFLIGTIGILVYGAIVYFTTIHEVRFGVLAIYGVIGAVVSELGDLAFSLIKREHDIKDYGNLLPGHGGMMDRLDSMVFTAQTMYLLVMVLPAIIVV